MPQLVKGGKHAFGWSPVGDDGEVALPPDALKEYGFSEVQEVILMPGSRTSGGFVVVAQDALQASRLGGFLKGVLEPGGLSGAEGAIYRAGGRVFYRIMLRGGRMRIPLETLERFGVKAGDKLLAVRGSGLGLALVVRGPIVREAGKHRELAVFE
jgi:hypothetical protein